MNEAKQELAPRQEFSRQVTPMDMLNMAVQQGADLDKLERLMDLQQRWEANEARKAFVAALNAFKSAAPELRKNKRVEFKGTRYDHASLDHVSEAIGRALAAHGLSHRWDVQQDNGAIGVTCVLTHEGGHRETVTLTAPADNSGSKNNIQSIGSTITYLQRYSLLAATGMAAKDQDDDGRMAEPPPRITPQQVSLLTDLLRSTGTDEVKFFKWAQVDDLSKLPAGLYERAVAFLKRKQQEAGK